MPQMSPLMWVPLYFFFLTVLVFFLVINYFIKPYEIISSPTSQQQPNQLIWKL